MLFLLFYRDKLKTSYILTLWECLWTNYVVTWWVWLPGQWDVEGSGLVLLFIVIDWRPGLANLGDSLQRKDLLKGVGKEALTVGQSLDSWWSVWLSLGSQNTGSRLLLSHSCWRVHESLFIQAAFASITQSRLTYISLMGFVGVEAGVSG